uniref:Transposase n=1 Tax=Bradyrhizobium barranii subsp. barranii TaxID=2823807 RepID=A0A939MK56_9BRAD
MGSTRRWALDKSVKTYDAARSGDGTWVVYAKMANHGICPGCNRRSRHAHRWRERRLQDLAAQGEQVTVRLRVRRWRAFGQTATVKPFPINPRLLRRHTPDVRSGRRR